MWTYLTDSRLSHAVGSARWVGDSPWKQCILEANCCWWMVTATGYDQWVRLSWSRHYSVKYSPLIALNEPRFSPHSPSALMHLYPVLTRVSDSLATQIGVWRRGSTCRYSDRAGWSAVGGRGGPDSTVTSKWSWFFVIGCSATDGTECLNSCCDGTNGSCARRLCCKVMTAHSNERRDLSFNCSNLANFAYWTPFVGKGLERNSWGQTEKNHEISWMKMATFWLWEGAEANNDRGKACRTVRCRDVDTLHTTHSTHHSSTITWRSLIPSRSYIASILGAWFLWG